jgi:hypothetical protein
MPQRHSLLVFADDFAQYSPLGCGSQNLVRLVVWSDSRGSVNCSHCGWRPTEGTGVHTWRTTSQPPWRVAYLNNNALATKVIVLHCFWKESEERGNLYFFWTVAFLPILNYCLRSAAVDRLVPDMRVPTIVRFISSLSSSLQSFPDYERWGIRPQLPRDKKK